MIKVPLYTAAPGAPLRERAREREEEREREKEREMVLLDDDKVDSDQ